VDIDRQPGLLSQIEQRRQRARGSALALRLAPISRRPS